MFAVLALRATGIGFLMITLALGQILWGIAYRWANLTNGDNGVNVSGRPAPFGISLAGAQPFYFATLIVFLMALGTMALFVRSPFGASLRGARDQARRMTALGYNVWLIRFLAFLFSGFWSGIAGILFVYYNEFISPQIAALQTSAEVLLMVISGGTATLAGPIVGAAIVVITKNVVSAYVVRWNMVLGLIFVAIITFMPEGLVPGTARLWRWAWRRRTAPAKPQSRIAENGHDRASRRGPDQVVRRLARHQGRQSRRRGGRAAAHHRAQRRRQDHAVQPDHRRDFARRRLDRAVRPRHHLGRRAGGASISGWRAPTRSSRCSRATPSCAT